MIVRLAPAFVYDVAPFRTTGTRITWATGEDWLAGLLLINARRCSAKQYVDQAEHLDDLARRPYVIRQTSRDVLEHMRELVIKTYQPPKGGRAGTTYERVINDINNAIGRSS